MDAGNVLQLLALLVVFVLILFATYYVTKWIARAGAIQTRARNIKVVETFKITQNKYIQIIQLGSKYYAIGISKDNIAFLTCLEEEQLDFTETPSAPGQIKFKDLFDRFAAKRDSQGNKK